MRVIAEEAGVHTGPGFGYRVVYVAKRDEVLPAIGRATNDHWFRVQLPDGTYGWILGDEVFPLDVDTSDGAPRPVDLEAHGRRDVLALAARRGRHRAHVLGGRARRRRHVHVPSRRARWRRSSRSRASWARRVGDQADVIFAGGGFNSNLFPSSPVTPFAAVAAGGAFGRKKADQFTIKTGNYTMLNVGGGLLVALKKRLTLRGEARHYVIFDANHTQRIQEYSGALCVYF